MPSRQTATVTGPRALVIGGGPAGVATAGWLSRYEAPYDWVDREGEVGGMLRTVHNPIVDFPGIPGRDGPEVAAELSTWVDATMAPPSRGVVESITRTEQDAFVVSIDGEDRRYEVVVLATGSRRRTLDVPGEREGLGEYILLSTTRNPESFRDHRVAVIGGADAAVEGCLNLARAGAREVILVARSRVEAQRHFVEEFRETPTTRQYPGEVEVVRFERTDEGCRLHFDDGASLDVDAAFVRIGVDPVLPVVTTDPPLEVDDGGFVIVNDRGETNVPGLYAVGDVARTPLRAIATSLGDGTRAGRAAAERLGIWRSPTTTTGA